MADFDRIFAKDGAKEVISDVDYNLGWDEIAGDQPPTKIEFNAIMNEQDEKSLFLYDELLLIQGISSGPTPSIFTASGTYTKPDGLKRAKVTVTAGGGGGSSSGNASRRGGGGGAGGTSISYFLAEDIPDSVVVLVGAAGVGSATPSGNGTDGGTSVFGSLVGANGGQGGFGGGASAGGIGGTIGTGQILAGGGDGEDGNNDAATDPNNGAGNGGASFFGGGGRSGAGPGITAKGIGGGGGGAVNGGQAGFGAAGIVIVEEFF